MKVRTGEGARTSEAEVRGVRTSEAEVRGRRERGARGDLAWRVRETRG